MILRQSDLSNRVGHLSGDETRYDCVFCCDTGQHMYVNRYKKMWYCFKCGCGGKFVVEGESQFNYFDVYELYKEILAKEHKEVRTLPRMIPIIQEGFDGGTRIAYDYLLNRGVIAQEILNNRIGWCPDREGPYANSIVFPVDGSHYFVCRKMDGKPKYINAPWPKQDSIYIPWIQTCDINFALVEGPLDAIKTSRITITAALLGKQANQEQLTRIVKWGRRFLILLDPDAWQASVKLKLGLESMADQLDKKIQVVNVFLDKWDPGDMKTKELEKIITQATKRFK